MRVFLIICYWFMAMEKIPCYLHKCPLNLSYRKEMITIWRVKPIIILLLQYSTEQYSTVTESAARTQAFFRHHNDFTLKILYLKILPNCPVFVPCTHDASFA